MKIKNTACLLVIMVLLSIFLAGCKHLTVDNSLSPPIIGSPIYNCTQIISYRGADRDAKIRIYVNGSKVIDFNTWMGWGTVKLPNTLDTGDVVSAAQIIDDRISVKTRQPVTVKNVPSNKLIAGERLITPKIRTPLYECQKCIMVENVVEGATVRLAKNGTEIRDSMTPFNHIRHGVPELVLYDEYDAWQELCYKSGLSISSHSDKEKVEKKPDVLPTPKIHEPIVIGNDACRVDNLFFGASVKIFADDGSGPVSVGGGTAIGSALIYRINPPFNDNFTYYAVQYLCNLESDPSKKTPPVKEVPAPVVRAPLCEDEIYVTVCNTVVMSTVEVFSDGTKVAQAAGNGDCFKLVLGDAYKLTTGKKITARQIVFGLNSPMSDPVMVRPNGAPPYEPWYWNDPATVDCNNCYNYGCNIKTNTFAQPGYAHNVSHSLTCQSVTTAAQADGLAPTNIEKACRKCSHLVALVIAPNRDYHWYRLDDNGRWSHKMASFPAQNTDGSGNLITNPETADRRLFIGDDFIRDYSIFCGYFCVDKDNVIIDGRYSCP